MASAVQKPAVTPTEYLTRERLAEFKSEYYDGRVNAMAGTSFRHGIILMNLSGELFARLKGGPCQPCVSDIRLRTEADNSFLYPDLMVICGEPRFADDEFDTVLNPTVIIEVLSPSTESWDRGGESDQYRAVASHREYVLVSQSRRLVERYSRLGEEWSLMGWAAEDDALTLESIGCNVPLRDIYRNVVLDATA